MTELELVTLEDNKVCIVLNEIEIDNIKYVYLVNSQDKTDYIIRKEINDELIGLDNEIEFENAIKQLIINTKPE